MLHLPQQRPSSDLRTVRLPKHGTLPELLAVAEGTGWKLFAVRRQAAALLLEFTR